MQRLERAPARPTADMPELSGRQIAAMHRQRLKRMVAEGRGRKDRVTMLLDHDIVAVFRSQGPGYQTRINDALRTFLLRRRPMGKPDALIVQAMDCLAQAKSELSTAFHPKKRAG